MLFNSISPSGFKHLPYRDVNTIYKFCHEVPDQYSKDVKFYMLPSTSPENLLYRLFKVAGGSLTDVEQLKMSVGKLGKLGSAVDQSRVHHLLKAFTAYLAHRSAWNSVRHVAFTTVGFHNHFVFYILRLLESSFVCAMTASNPKFSVAIIGGGIGGVTLAIALSKYPDIRFDLYEAAGAFEEIGAGVGIFARSLYALEDLGLIDALETINTPSSLSENAWDYRKADLHPTGKKFARRFYATDLKGSGNYHRAQLLTLLVSLLPEHVQNECIHFKKRLVRYENNATDGQVTMHFADGSTATSSVLIGADGIKSPTRQGMIAERAALETDDAEKARILKHALPRWSGMVAYRGLVSADEVEAISGEPHRCTKDRIMYCGRKAHLVVFPIAMGKMINVVAFVSKNVLPEHKAAAAVGTIKDDERTWPEDKPWIEPVPQEEMLEAYDGFEEEAIALLKCIKSPSRWAIHELDPLPFYAHGNVAVLGDAAHATQPHAGQGANQSIEDAYTLALALGSPYATAQTIPKALKAYEQARLTRANEVIVHSSQAGKMHQFMKDPEYDDLDQLKAYIEGNWNRWLFIGSPRKEAEAAINSVFNAD